MSLIERVGGINAARKIVEGAPEGCWVYAELHDPEIKYFAKSSEYLDEPAMILDGNHWTGVDDGYPHNRRLDYEPYVRIDDLRAALAEQDKTQGQVITDSDQLQAFLNECRWMVIDGTRNEKGCSTDLRTQMCWHFWTKALKLKDHGND